MADAESEEAGRVQIKVPDMPKSTSKMVLSANVMGTGIERIRSSLLIRKDEQEGLLKEASLLDGYRSLHSVGLGFGIPIFGEAMWASSAEKEREFRASLAERELPASLAEMENEDLIRLQNQFSEKIRADEVYFRSSSARLPIFSMGLSSSGGKIPPRPPLHESSVDPKDKSSPLYFELPEHRASVFVGDVDGLITITYHLFDEYPDAIFHKYRDAYAVGRSIYEDDRPGGLRCWLQTQPKEFWSNMRYNCYSRVILRGNELFFGPESLDLIILGNLGRKSSKVCGSSFDYKDCTGDETIRRPSDIVGAPVPGSDIVEQPTTFRPGLRCYCMDPMHDGNGIVRFNDDAFADFVVLGNRSFKKCLSPDEVIDIVQKNASQTTDVIATQLVISALEKHGTTGWFPPRITAIVILLDLEKTLRRKEKNEERELKEEKMTTLKEEEKVLREDKEEITKEDKEEFMKTLDFDPLINIPQRSTTSPEENELGRKSTAISSSLTHAKVQDDFGASSSIALIEGDDCSLSSAKMQDDFDASSSASLIEYNEDRSIILPKNKDFKITKWIICGDLVERTVLCFFNMEENQFEFYFEDHKSMATIIGLGVPHSKAILERGNSHVTVVEIPEEDWDDVWAHSNVIPPSIPEGNVLQQESFPDILHRIANVINSDNIVSKANNGGTGGDNGKGKAQGNADDKNGKADDHDGHENIGNPDGGSNGPPDDNGKKGRKGKDGNDDKNNHCDGDDGKSSNNCKELQAVVHLDLLPGGVFQEKEKKKELGEIHEGEVKEKEDKLREDHKEEVEGKEEKLGEIHEEEGKGKEKELREVCEEKPIEVEKKKTDKILEEVVEEKRKEGESCNRVEKKKKSVWDRFKRGENGNAVGKQQKWPTTKGIEDGDVDENLQKELEKEMEKQIHSHLVFTFTIKDEAGGPLKTIQATIDPITFQFPPNNEENYLQRKRFGWFHEKLQVAFKPISPEVANLVANSCKALNCLEAKGSNLQGHSKGNSRSSTNSRNGEVGFKYIFNATGGVGRTFGSEDKTTEEVHNSWDTYKTITKGHFSVVDRTDLNSHQLKYSYFPPFPFNEKEFETKDEVNCLKMYENPICQLQQVSCEGTWQPDDPKNLEAKNLEAYKLEASRDIGMTRIYNLDPRIGEEKNQKGVGKVGKNLPLSFIQKLEKVVYLNHTMSHLTSSTTGVYRLKERQDQSDPSTTSTTSVTQAQNRRNPEWPGNDPLVDVKKKGTFECS